LAAAHEQKLLELTGELEGLDRLETQVDALLQQNRELKRRAAVTVPGEKRSFSRRRFAGMVQGMPEEELRTYLGPPDAVEEGTPSYYVYNRPLTIHGSRADQYVKIQISGGVVTRCYFPAQ
jgi:hypothetical protein